MSLKTIERDMAAVRSTLEKLTECQATNAVREEAFMRFQTVGATALPMTSEHVAIVLDFDSLDSISNQVTSGRLRKRFRGRACFHPDDVRAFMVRRPKLEVVNAPSSDAQRFAAGFPGRAQVEGCGGEGHAEGGLQLRCADRGEVSQGQPEPARVPVSAL